MTKNIALTTTQIELHVPEFGVAKGFYVRFSEPDNILLE